MKRKMLLTAISAVVLCAMSCARNIVDDPASQGLPVSLSPSFGHSESGQGAVTRVTSTDFEVGDALGLYVVTDGREFEHSGNSSDNARMEVLAGGAISGSPRAVYYPDDKRLVSLYSYYPHTASVGDVYAHRFAVSADQSVLTQYKASDFCYGRKLGVTPSTSAQSLNYSHKMSQVLVNVTVPSTIGGKRVASVASAAMFRVQSEVDVNLSTGALAQVTQRVDSIVMYRSIDVTPDVGATTTHFTAIVPAQAVAARDASSGGLVGLTVRFEDNSELYYIYYNLVEIAFVEGSSNTLNLVVGDGGSVVLSSDPVVSSWATVTVSGIMTQPINNSFTAIWKLPIKDYKKINRVVLGINDPITGTVKEFVMTDFSLNADNSADKVIFKFNFVIGVDDVLSYPYTIDYVEFFEDQSSLRKCQSVIAANVTRRGAYTIGVDAQYVVAITSGTVENWDDLLYGDITRGVDNDFRVSLIEYPHYADIATIKLQIDGEIYAFNNAGCIAGSNVLVATTRDVRFPDANGRAPYKYPFTIENVALYNSGGALVADGSYPASVAVNRAGLVTLRMYKGVITSTTATVTGYNTSGGVGRPEFGGAVENNPLRIVYCYGAATEQLSCLDVEKVDLLINNQTVTLSGYKALMTGTTLAAQSSDPQVNIADGAGSKPTTYPYYISRITLRKADGTMLFSSALDEPLKVDWYGGVTIEIMEKMAEGIAEVIEMNGLRWATGNLVADGKGGCKIGAPGDAGLYFQYGGLVGYKGGATGDGSGIINAATNGKFWGGADAFSTNDISVTPAGYSKPKDKWSFFDNYSAGGYGYYYYKTLASKGADFSAQPNGYDPSLGVGDPCAHYLGGDWRMPNYVELSAITGNSTEGAWAPWSTAGVTGKWVASGPQSTMGAWFGPNSRSGTPTTNTDLFIPASGYRNGGDGAFFNVGANGYLWSSSVYDYYRGFYLDIRESYGVIPRSVSGRAYAFPVRCVQGKKKVTEPIPPAASDILVLNGLKWTKGNLVAAGSNNARVGAPGDGGLYFQYGGLVGYKGGATGDGTGMSDPELTGKYWGFAGAFSSSDVALTPSGYTKPTNAYLNFDNQSSGGYGYYYYNTLVTKYADFQKQPNGKDVALGVGDPCETYLGSPWRLPTYVELSAITGSIVEGDWVPWSDATVSGKYVVNGPPSSRTKGVWFGPNSKTGTPDVNADLFIPASGYRYYNDGAFFNVGANGYLWSSSVYDYHYGFYLLINESSGIYPRAGGYRIHAFPVRCVTDDVVEIGGVKWAKGNLVANGENFCVIGKPGDAGLYFQYGGLVGYKGGANGDGRGITNATTHPDGKWWGGAAAYSANDVAVAPATYATKATWPYFNNVAVGGFGYYYFNTFVTKYADFQAQANANNPTLGIGDPCTYYLGSPWRLPKYDELSAITGSSTEEAWVPWSTAGVTGKWSNSGPQSTKGAWFGPNSRSGTPTTDTDLFLPASGYRDYNDGAFYDVGISGLLWSSSVYDYRLGFGLGILESDGVVPRNWYSRAYAFPVRCVKN